MAKAKSFTRKITRTVVEEVPGYIELNLTPEEASVLMFIASLTGGTPGEGNPRGAVDSIRKALYAAGARHGDYKCGYDLSYSRMGAIYLENING